MARRLFLHSFRSSEDKNAYVVQLRDPDPQWSDDAAQSTIVESILIPVDAPAHEVIAAIEILVWRNK